MNKPNEATVKTLSAEVKTLMMESRQVTMGVFNQLDQVHPDNIIPFGRVRPFADATVWVVGRHKDKGTLVKSRVDPYADHHDDWLQLDLIVLAGLR